MPNEASSVDTGQLYFELHHQMHRAVDQAMCAAGLTLARAKVLMRLDVHGPMNQARLAQLLGFSPPSVTEAVDGLERDGLVSRGQDPHDRRARIVALTEAGQVAAESAAAIRNKSMDEVFGVLSPAQRGRLVSLLTTIRTNLTQGVGDCGQ